MMITFLFILCVILFGAIVIKYSGKMNILKLTVFSLTGFFALFILISGIFFWIDKFSLSYVLLFSLFVELIIFVYLTFIKNMKFKNIKIHFELKSVIIPIIIAIVIIPFTITKFGFFGMGQDQGVYQTEAINIINDISGTQYDFNEFNTISDEADRETYLKTTLGLFGFDNYDYEFPNTSKEKELSDVSGIIHGVPTYSAILALWGKIFGIENMMGIQTLFFILALFMLFFICQNFNFKKITSSVILTIFAFSPVVLWVSKSSLTEMFTCVLLLTFIYFMTFKDNTRYIWLSSFAVLTFSFFHVSIYTFMPMFVILYVVMYLITKNRVYIYSMMISTAAYMIGFLMTSSISPFYIFNNYKPVYFGNLINKFNLTLIIIFVCIFIFIFGFISIFLFNKININENKIIENLNSKKIFSVIISVLIILPCLYLFIKSILARLNFTQWETLSISGFVYACGFFPILLAFVFSVLKPKIILESKENIAVFIMFFYCVLFYSSFLRQTVEHYYYYGRYLVPLIPIALIFMGIILDRLNYKIVISAGMAGILLFFIRYDFVIMTQPDDTNMSYSTLSEITEPIDENDAVIIDPDMTYLLFFPIKSMTGADVYPVFDDLSAQEKNLSEKYDDVFYINDFNFLHGTSPEYKLLYRKSETVYYDDLLSTNRFIPYPVSFTSYDTIINVYKYLEPKTLYSFADEEPDFDSSGFSYPEMGYTWINSQNSEIVCTLHSDKYQLKITPGAPVPFELIGNDKLNAHIYLNDKLISEYTFTLENNTSPVLIDIPKEAVIEGRNYLKIETDLWSPSSFGSTDTRELGFSVSSIEFIPAD